MAGSPARRHDAGMDPDAADALLLIEQLTHAGLDPGDIARLAESGELARLTAELGEATASD